MGSIEVATYVVLGLVAIGVFLYFVPLGLWQKATTSGIDVSVGTLVAMRLRRINPAHIVEPLIRAKGAGLDVTLDKLEAHYLSGGNVDDVVDALIAARAAQLDFDFYLASAFDLAGRNVPDIVQAATTPRIITTPDVQAVPKDGRPVTAHMRLTARTDLDHAVGGAGEETLVERVSDSLRVAIEACETHTDVLEDRGVLARTMFQQRLDLGTAFKISSVDVLVQSAQSVSKPEEPA